MEEVNNMKTGNFMNEAEIGKRIMEVRKAAGLSQQEFGDRIKISRTHVGSIEKNQRTINDRLINLICITFDVNEQWLRTGKGAMFDRPKNHKMEKAMINFNKLDDLLQDFVLKEIDSLLEYMNKREKRKR
jgi:transcriptional regulator with XRE-family HTH domain